MSSSPQKRNDIYSENSKDKQDSGANDNVNITDISGSATRRRLKNDATRLGQTATDIANDARRNYQEGKPGYPDYKEGAYYRQEDPYENYSEVEEDYKFGQRQAGKRYDEREAFNRSDRADYRENMNSRDFRNQGSAYRDDDYRLQKSYPQYEGPNPLGVFLRSLLAFLALAALLWIFFLIYNANNAPIRPAVPDHVVTDRVTTQTDRVNGNAINNGGNGIDNRNFQGTDVTPTYSPRH